MNTQIAAKPQATLLKPLAMFSAPRLGPMVISSMISMGAASEPARSSSAVSLASTVVMLPEICTRPPPISLADHRRGHDLALALLEQQDGHALADVLARDVAEDARALGVQRQVHGRLLRLAVEAGLRVGEVLAGQDDLPAARSPDGPSRSR